MDASLAHSETFIVIVTGIAHSPACIVSISFAAVYLFLNLLMRKGYDI